VKGIRDAYAKLWGVVKLPAVLRLSGVLVLCRLAFLPVESAATLKLIQKGVAKVRSEAGSRAVTVWAIETGEG
jgi:MFS transporter, PAT family, solute carrier family 33 (acetyl-CoA transportor), member 1